MSKDFFILFYLFVLLCFVDIKRDTAAKLNIYYACISFPMLNNY